jgi:predicted dienelactone hydrolase
MTFPGYSELVPYILWAIVSALIAGLLALALNRWTPHWSRRKRNVIAVGLATFPTFGIAGALMMVNPLLSVWWSLDEFIIPFAVQIALILVFSVPVVMLAATRDARTAGLKEVFD